MPDQLSGYLHVAADLHLCFRTSKNRFSQDVTHFGTTGRIRHEKANRLEMTRVVD